MLGCCVALVDVITVVVVVVVDIWVVAVVIDRSVVALTVCLSVCAGSLVDTVVLVVVWGVVSAAESCFGVTLAVGGVLAVSSPVITV